MTEPLLSRAPVEAELDRLQQMLLEMAGRAEELVRMAMQGLRERDRRMTRVVRKADDRIDELEVEIDERVLELLALQHPMAGDLRLVFVALKASNDVERIGDHAVNIAKASRRLGKHPPLPDIMEIWEMGGQVRGMLGTALDAMMNRDVDQAKGVIAEDQRVDDLRRSAIRIIVSYMLEQPRYISPGLEMILVVQNLERIGDLAIVEHLGGPTDFFLGYGIRPGHDVAPQHNRLECTVAEVGEYCGIYHHAAFYDMLGAIVLFGVLYWLYHRSRLVLRYGQLFAVWVAWYGFQRLFIDFTRLALDVDGDRTLGALTWSQWSGLAAGIAGIAGLLWLGRRNRAVSPENDRLHGAVTTAPEPD